MSIPHPQTPIHLLMVEPPSALVEALALALQQKFGPRLTISHCAGEAEALARMNTSPANIIIAHTQLADGDGLTLCRALRAQPQFAELPILLIGEQTSARDKIAGFLSGADDFVVRPIDNRLLVARIELLLRLKGIGRLHVAAP